MPRENKEVKGLQYGIPIGFFVGLFAARWLVVVPVPETSNFADISFSFFDFFGSAFAVGLIIKPLRAFARKHVTALALISGFAGMSFLTTRIIVPLLSAYLQPILQFLAAK